MAPSRRAKSQSVSSTSGAGEGSSTAAGTPNGIMAPPSPSTATATTTSTPKTTRHRKTPSTASAGNESMTTKKGRIASAAAAAAEAVTPTTPLKDTLPASPSPPSLQLPTAPKPGVAQFVLVAGLSVLAEAVLQSIASQFGTGDLAAVSKHSESWFEVGGLLGWKIMTIAVYWFGGFDAYDVASITLLLRTPTLLLLSFFYLLQPSGLLLTTAATLISTTLPFLFFRPLSPTHTPKTHAHAPRQLLRNRSIITDPYTTISTTILSTAIFTVILELSFQTFLPVHLVTTFDGLRSLEFIHLGPAGLPVLLLVLLPAGFACTEYLFTPSTGTTDTHTQSYSFDTVNAGFGAHVYHNAWGWYTARQRTLIGRSLILSLLIIAETVVECAIGLKGVDVTGAVGYAAVWATAVGVTATVLDWVGGPSD